VIEVGVFGWLAITLTSWLSVLLLITALSAVTYLSLCLLAESRSSVPLRRIGFGSAVASFGLCMIGLRFAGPYGSAFDGLALLGVSTAFAAASGGAAASLSLRLWRAARALQEGRRRRRAELVLEEGRRADEAEAASRRRLDGDDLRADLAEAETSVGRLRTALGALREIRRSLVDKVEQLEGTADHPPSILEDCARARDDTTTKIQLAEHVLTEAEAALFRLRCNQPVRWLVRRRPSPALIDPSSVDGGAVGGAAARHVERAEQSVATFLREVDGARTVLAALDAQRPANLEDDDHDPLHHARAEVDTMATAYAAVLLRLQVARMHLASSSQTEALARAAGALSERTRGVALDSAEVEQLLAELARAEAGSRTVMVGDPSARALVEALARSAAALDRSDAGSLRDLCGAMREIG